MTPKKQQKRVHQSTRAKKRWVLGVLLLLFSVIAQSSLARAQATNLAWSSPVDITGGISRNVRSFAVFACDPYQNVHLFWADQSERGAAIFYRNDADETWSFPNDILAVPDNSIYYLRTAISPQTDTIHLSWVNMIANAVLYYSSAPLSKADDPAYWMTPQIIALGASNSDISVDPSGTLHMVYSSADDSGINNEVYHITSTDDGDTWSDPELIFSRTFSQASYIQVWIDIDNTGRVHVGLTLRSQEYGAVSEVGYLRSLENGGWSDYRMVDETGTTFQGVAWIEPFAFDDNEVHLTWHDPRRMHQWSLDGGQTWSQPVEILPLGGAFGGPNELVKDQNGSLHVVLAVSNGVYTAEWVDQQWGPPQLVDSRNIDPHGQHLLSCGGDTLHMVYYDRTGDQTVWYTHRKIAAAKIGRQPIPQPTEDPNARLVEATVDPASLISAPTANPVRETLAAVELPPPTETNFTMAQLLTGVIPAAILIVGVLLIALIKVRR